MKPRWETPKPSGVAGSYGYAAIAWGERELGISPGPWQARVIVSMLRHDAAGNLIHRTALISTGRQNGKSVIVRIIVGWMLDEGRLLPAFAGWTTILAAAHDAKQARIIYRGVYGDLSSIPRLLEASRGARKHQTVRLTEHFGISVGALTLDTVTGQPGSSRGLSAGLVAWDEMLTQKDWDMWEALAPTQSAQQNPLMILTSSAGLADSVVLRAFYDRLLGIASGDRKPDRTFYGAWWQSTDPDAGLDWRQVRQANPAIGDGRLKRAAIIAEHAVLPPDSWRRERLNHFVDVKAEGAFNPGIWAACRTPEPLAGLSGPYALGIDIQPGWERATIAIAGIRGDGRIGVEILHDLREGTVTAQRIVDLVHAFPDPVQVIAFDQVSGAGSAFVRDGEETAWPWDPLKPAAVAAACMDVDEMIRSGRLAVDDPLLDAQIANTARRPVGQDGAFRFDRTHSLGPIDAVFAMTFAAHAIAYVGAIPAIA